jgi:hypothetical protein
VSEGRPVNSPSDANHHEHRQAVAGRLAALVAATLALSALMGTANALAGSGGVGTGGDGCGDYRFGSRTLQHGDCGGDVKTLNWLLRAKASKAVGLGPDYDGSTVSAVRAFERGAGLPANGVFEESTRTSLVSSLATDHASWYGGPLNGNHTACGQILRRQTIGVAHKTLPCGTKVVFGYKGHWVRTRVIDRGPYVKGREWDLTQATADRLHFTPAGVDAVRVAVLR